MPEYTRSRRRTKALECDRGYAPSANVSRPLARIIHGLVHPLRSAYRQRWRTPGPAAALQVDNVATVPAGSHPSRDHGQLTRPIGADASALRLRHPLAAGACPSANVRPFTRYATRAPTPSRMGARAPTRRRRLPEPGASGWSRTAHAVAAIRRTPCPLRRPAARDAQWLPAGVATDRRVESRAPCVANASAL